MQVQQLAPDVCPLLVFVNPRSGGLKGRDLLRSFRKLLNPHQVFDISNGGPLAGWVGRPIMTRGWSLAGALTSSLLKTKIKLQLSPISKLVNQSLLSFCVQPPHLPAGGAVPGAGVWGRRHGGLGAGRPGVHPPQAGLQGAAHGHPAAGHRSDCYCY